jgi:hypothetical protein
MSEMARHVALAALPCRPREMVFLLCRLRSANEGTRYQSLSSVLTTSTAAKLVVGREGSRRLEPLLPQGFVWSSPCKFERKNEGTRSSDSDSEVEEQEVRRPLIPCARVKERGRDLPSASVRRTVLLVRGTPAARLLFVAVALPALRRSCTTFDAKFNNGQHDDKRRRCLSGTLLTRGGKGNPSHGTVVAGCRRSSRPTAVCRQPGLVAGDFVPCPRHCHQYLHTGPRYPSKSDFGYLKSIRNYSAPEPNAMLLSANYSPVPVDRGQPDRPTRGNRQCPHLHIGVTWAHPQLYRHRRRDRQTISPLLIRPCLQVTVHTTQPTAVSFNKMAMIKGCCYYRLLGDLRPAARPAI